MHTSDGIKWSGAVLHLKQNEHHVKQSSVSLAHNLLSLQKDVMQEESNGFTWAIDSQLKLVRLSQLDAGINIERT